MMNSDTNPPAANQLEALRWMVQYQRGLAYNLGYLDIPMPDEEIPSELTWQAVVALHEVEYELLNDFVCRRMAQGQSLAPEWTTRPPDIDDDED